LEVFSLHLIFGK